MHIILISPSGNVSFSVIENIKFGNESRELAIQMPIVVLSAVTSDILGFSGYTIAMNLGGRWKEERRRRRIKVLIRMRAEALKKWIRFRSRPFSGCKSDFGSEKKGKKIIQPSTA